MTNPTSNFGWQMPTSTDLVTDLPADFAVFGQAVDTSMADLKGGTTGQILSKATNTDMDFTWVTNDVGDITAVTAGTGITGGGTSGAVTITNDMATTITAAGDIVIGTGSGTYDNLPIGTTAQVLTADTTVSPYKVKWATPSTPTAQGVWATNSTDLSISSGTFTTITADSETYDTDGFHSTVTNTGRLTVPTGLGGKYIASFNLYCTGALATMWYGIWQVNGNNANRVVMKSGGGSESQTLAITQHFNLSAGDYVTIQVYQASGSTYTVSIGQYGGFGMMRIGA